MLLVTWPPRRADPQLRLLTRVPCVFPLQNMWIERTVYTTAYKLPGILRWFEVKSVFMVSAPPKEPPVTPLQPDTPSPPRCVLDMRCRPHTRPNPETLSPSRNIGLDVLCSHGLEHRRKPELRFHFLKKYLNAVLAVLF